MKINYDLKVGFTAALIGFAAAILITSMGCEYYTEKPVLAGQPRQETPTDPAACPGELVNGLCTITVDPPASTPIVCGEGTTLENGICVASVSCPDGTVVDGVCVPPVADDPPAEDPVEPTSPWSGITGVYTVPTQVAYFVPPPPEGDAGAGEDPNAEENPDEVIEETFGIAGSTVPASGGLSEDGESVNAGDCSELADTRPGPYVVGVGLHTFIDSRMDYSLNSWIQVRTLTGIYLDCRWTRDWVEAEEVASQPEDDPHPGLRRLPGDRPPPPPSTPQENWEQWIRHLDHAALLDEAEEDPNDHTVVGSAAPAGHVLVGVKLMKCQQAFVMPRNHYCGAKGLFRRVTRNGNILDETPIPIEVPENDDYAPDTNASGNATNYNTVVQCPESDQVVTSLHFRKPSTRSVGDAAAVTWVDLTCSRISAR